MTEISSLAAAVRDYATRTSNPALVLLADAADHGDLTAMSAIRDAVESIDTSSRRATRGRRSAP